MTTGTLRGESEAGEAAPPAAPYLFLVLSCAAPRSGALRLRLGGLDEVALGRGSRRDVTVRGAAATMTLDDPRASSTHARLVRAGGAWTLEDLGSTNGTRMSGRRIGRATLADGAVFQVGETLFVFRESLSGHGAAVLDRTTFTPGLATMLPDYEEEIAAFARMAVANVPILLLGETGTGKEVLARAAHRTSGRTGPFVAVNCGALPEALTEGQLFGHVKGSFSGAVRDEVGFVRASHGGTLFLDEIGDMPPASQAALLRVVQEREVTPVGSTRPVKVDLRIVAATHRSPESAAFRADLHARLAGYTHVLPPLRERREDLGILLGALLAAPIAVAPDLARGMIAYDWPRNIRELEQCLSVASVLATDRLAFGHLPQPLRGLLVEAEGRPEPDEDMLRARLAEALAAHAGNITDVSRALGRTRMQIHRWMKRWNIDPAPYRLRK